jgi:tyrosine-protein kinase Etk/Wzc
MNKPLSALRSASDPAPAGAATGPVPPLHEGKEHGIVEYLGAIYAGRWLIAIAVAVALGCGLFYLFLVPPEYESDALVQVEPERAKGLLGQLDDLPGLPPSSTPADTEMEILRSRTLLGAVVDELGLDVVARPRYVPLLGAAVARLREPSEPGTALPWLSSFAWGGERFQVSRLDVPPRLEDRWLLLVDRGGGRFELEGPDKLDLKGQVGTLAQARTTRAADRTVEVLVSEMYGRPGTQFRVKKLSRHKAIQELQDRLAIVEKGKKTGVIRIGLSGPDPDRIAATLNAISRSYLRQNVERKSAEAEQTLHFVSAQLPVLKGNLEQAEATLAAYRSSEGQTDLSLETKALLERTTEIEKRAGELALQRAELLQRFTETHPSMLTLHEKERSIESERASVNGQLKVLPASELKSVRLMRDVKVANELYVLLLNKSQQLKVAKSGTLGNVRILDEAAIAREPTSPRVASTLALFLVAGMGIGIALALGRRSLFLAVEDPEEIERGTGLAVYASIPHSTIQEHASDDDGRDVGMLLAATHPSDIAVEAMRSLRTSILFALLESKNNVIALGGPSPGIGKSFVCANLGYVLAEAGRRVVVVDADLRKGRLHRYYQVQRGPGLTELIDGSATLDQALRSTSLPNLSVVPMGKPPANPSELLGSHRFGEVLGSLSSRFEIVLVDTPPVLAVTDGAIVGRHAALTLLVLRAGEHSLREILYAMKRLDHNGVRVHAAVLNDVQTSFGGLGRQKYHYHYEYK